MDRRRELTILAHSMAAMPPGQLALRRKQAIELLEELTELRGRHDALVAESSPPPSVSPACGALPFDTPAWRLIPAYPAGGCRADLGLNARDVILACGRR
jgi:hypothetical protein